MKVGIWFLVFLVVIGIAGAVTDITHCDNLSLLQANLSGEYHLNTFLSCPTQGCITTGGACFEGSLTGNGTLADIRCTLANQDGYGIFGGHGANWWDACSPIIAIAWQNVTVTQNAASHDGTAFLVGSCAAPRFYNMSFINCSFIKAGGGVNTGWLCGYINGAGAIIDNVYFNQFSSMVGFEEATHRAGLFGGNVGSNWLVNRSYSAANATGVGCFNANNYGDGSKIQNSFCAGNAYTLGQGIGSAVYYDRVLILNNGSLTGTIPKDNIYFTNASKNTYAPFTSWDSGIWKLDATGYPVFQWQYQTPDTPPTYTDFSGNVTNGSYGVPIRYGANWSDDVNISHYTRNIYNGTAWIEVGVVPFGDIAGCLPLSNCSFYEIVMNDYGTMGFKFRANDSANQWTDTGIWNVTIPEIYPQFSNLTQNVTSLVGSGAVGISVDWTDELGLEYWMASYWNTSHWINTTGPSYQNFSGLSNKSEYGLNPLNIPGNWSFKIYASNTQDNWNISSPLINVTVYGAYPQWYNYSQNATAIYQGSQVVFTANFTDAINLTHYIPSYWNTTHWINASNGILFGTYRVCVANYTNCQTLYAPIWSIPGIWRMKFYANNSQNNWNVSPTMNLTINAVNPYWWNYTQNSTTTYVGGFVNFNFRFGDTFNLSMYCNSYYNVSKWYNGTCGMASELTCTGSGTTNCSYTNTKMFPNTSGLWARKVFFNNSFGNWNVTPMLNVTVYDVYPNIDNTTINATAIILGDNPILWKANMSDYIKLSMPLRSIWNTTHWVNYTTLGFQYCNTGNTSCQTYTYQTIPTVEGTWRFKWFINNSFNNWNTSDTFNVTVTRLSYINLITQSLAPATVYVNQSITYTANFTTGLWSNVGYYWVGEIMPDLSRVNYTATNNSWTSCNGDRTSCYISINSTPSPVGIHGVRIYANDTYANENSTDWLNVTVLADTHPSYSSAVANITSFYPNVSTSINVNVTWDDNINLSFYRFSQYNQTDSKWYNSSLNPAFVNGNCVIARNTSCVANFSFWTNKPWVGSFSWKMYANDSQNQWSVTDMQNITLLASHPIWVSPSANQTKVYANATMNVKFTVGWTDIIDLDYFIISSYNVVDSTWNNGSITHFVSGDCYAPYTNCWAYATLNYVPPYVGNFSWKMYANDTDNNWNVTSIQNITVVEDKPPTWDAVSTNTTLLYNGITQGVLINSTWSDDVNVSFVMFAQYNETDSKWYNYTAWSMVTWHDYCARHYNDTCVFAEGIIWNKPYDGNWSWKVYANDTFNNWNVTAIQNITIETAQYPDWYNAQSNVTELFANTTTNILVSVMWNATFDLSHFMFSQYNETDSKWYNNTGAYIGSFEDMDCSINYNTSCNATFPLTRNKPYTGNWSWKMYANMTGDRWNVTDMQNVTISLVGNDAVAIINWTVTPCTINGNNEPVSWQQFEDALVTVELADDSNNVTARIVFYDGDVGGCEHTTAWSPEYYQNATIQFLLTNTSCLNASTFFTIQAKDVNGSYANTTLVNETVPFSVSTSGMIYGECTSFKNQFYNITGGPGTVTEPPSIADMFNQLAAMINLPGAMLILLLMICGIGIAWFFLWKIPIMAMAATVMIVFIFLFFAVQFQIINAALFFVIMALVLAVIGFVLWKVIT